MKNIFALFLAVIMSISFVACADSYAQNEATTETSAETNASEDSTVSQEDEEVAPEENFLKALEALGENKLDKAEELLNMCADDYGYLESLKHFNEGVDCVASCQFDEAISKFRKAEKIEFAQAYILALEYVNEYLKECPIEEKDLITSLMYYTRANFLLSIDIRSAYAYNYTDETTDTSERAIIIDMTTTDPLHSEEIQKVRCAVYNMGKYVGEWDSVSWYSGMLTNYDYENEKLPDLQGVIQQGLVERIDFSVDSGVTDSGIAYHKMNMDSLEKPLQIMNLICSVNEMREIQGEVAREKAAAEARALALKKAADVPEIGDYAFEALNSSWGEPTKKNITITSSGTVHEQWVYGNGKYVYVENGVVTGKQYSE